MHQQTQADVLSKLYMSTVMKTCATKVHSTQVLCLQGMGFSKSKAEEALLENNHNLEAAIEWLVANCI